MAWVGRRASTCRAAAVQGPSGQRSGSGGLKVGLPKAAAAATDGGGGEQRQ
jgi:hypothetical protein